MLLPLVLLLLPLRAPGVTSPAKAPTATQSRAPPEVRTFFVLQGNKALRLAAARSIVAPLRKAVHVIDDGAYRQAARRAGAHGPVSIEQAQRLAHALRLSHIVQLSAVRDRPGQRDVSLEAVVVVLGPTPTVQLAERFALRGRRLSKAQAHRIVERLTQALLAAPGHVPPAGDTDATAPLVAHGDAATTSEAEDASNDEPPRAFADRLRLSSALIGAHRWLQPTAAGDAPPCDCPASAFDHVIGGLRLDGAAFVLPGLDLGLTAAASILWAQKSVTTAEGRRDFSSWVFSGRLALAYRFWLPAGIELRPELGYSYYRFPLADGVLPGMSYAAPTIGARFGTNVGEFAELWAGGGYLIRPRMGVEAARLGQVQSAWGLRAEAGATFFVGRLELGLTGTFEQYVSAWRGQTALATPQRFVDITLADRLAQLALTAGGQLW